MHSSACKYQCTPTISQPPFPTPLRFSIKIQTEIEDLKGSRLWWARLCHCSRHIGVDGEGGGGVLSDPRAPSPHWGIAHLSQASSSPSQPVLIPPNRAGGVLDWNSHWNEGLTLTVGVLWVSTECRWSLSDSNWAFWAQVWRCMNIYR